MSWKYIGDLGEIKKTFDETIFSPPLNVNDLLNST